MTLAAIGALLEVAAGGLIDHALIRPTGFFANPNNLAAALLPALAVSYRRRSWSLLTLFAIVLLFTASRAALLGVFCALGWALLRNWQPLRAIKPIYVILALLAVVAVGLQFARSDHGSLAMRLDLWRVGLRVFLDHPIAGGSYAEGFLQYAQLSHERIHFHAHSLPIQIAAEHGLIGLAALAALIAWLIAQRRKLAARDEQIYSALLVALLSSSLLDYVYWLPGNVLALTAGILLMIYGD